MRTLLVLAAAVALTGAPVTSIVAADAAPAAAPAPAAKVPAANASLLQKLYQVAGQVTSAAQSAESTAASAASIPFAGSYAKDALAKAKAQLTDATGLQSDFGSLLGGKVPTKDGLLNQVAFGKTSITDRLKNLPGADILQKVLGTPGVATALIQQLPVNKVPGYEALSGLLSGIGAK